MKILDGSEGELVSWFYTDNNREWVLKNKIQKLAEKNPPK